MLLTQEQMIALRGLQPRNPSDRHRARTILCEHHADVNDETANIVLSQVHSIADDDVIHKTYTRMTQIAQDHGHRIQSYFWWMVIDGTSFILIYLERREGPLVEVGIVWKATDEKKSDPSSGSARWHGGGHLTEPLTTREYAGARMECDAPTYRTAKTLFKEWCAEPLKPPSFRAHLTNS